MYKTVITSTEAHEPGPRYINIPRDILEDKDLPDKAKILYGYLVLLTHKYGHCFASNSKLAELMNISKQYVSELVSKLKENGYIDVHIQYKPNSKEIKQRLITIGSIPAPTIEDAEWWEEESKEDTPIRQMTDTYSTNV